jgi:hypothetical protein
MAIILESCPSSSSVNNIPIGIALSIESGATANSPITNTSTGSPSSSKVEGMKP